MANPALKLTTLVLCNLASPMGDHLRLGNIGRPVHIHSVHTITV